MRSSTLVIVLLLATLAACSATPAAAPTAMPAAVPTAAPDAVAPAPLTEAQTAERIASAESAAPMAIARNSTIVDYPADPAAPLVVLREGTNGWTCFADWPPTSVPDPQCFDEMWMQWFEAYSTGTEPNITRIGLAYMLQGGIDASNTDPFATEPAPGEDWFLSPPHVMFIMPGKLDPALYSTDHHAGGLYIMWAGTPYEHIMMSVDIDAVAQTDDVLVSAESALPRAIAAGATIVDYAADPATPPPVVREGTNGWTCFPDWQATPGNDPQCFDKMWMQWLDAINTGTEPNTTALGLGYMLQGGSDASNTDPFAMEPAAGEDWITSPAHVMVIVPDKLDPAHYSSDHHSGGPYVMWAGTPYEHIMMPIK